MLFRKEEETIGMLIDDELFVFNPIHVIIKLKLYLKI